MSIDQAVKMKKSTWKREVKTKIKKKIQQRLTDDLQEKTKARTIRFDKTVPPYTLIAIGHSLF